MKFPLYLSLLLALPIAPLSSVSALAAPDSPASASLKADLIRAIETNNVAAAQALIANPNFDLNVPLEVYHSQPALVYAASKGRTAIVKAMLARADVNPNIASTEDETAIEEVSRDPQRLEILRALIAHPKTDLNRPSSSYGDTPVMSAAFGANIEGLKLLLASPRVNVAKKNSAQQTALHRAALGRSSTAIRLLLATKKIDPNAQTSYGDTALHYVAFAGDAGSIKSLLTAPNLNPNIKNKDGDTPLSLAAQVDMSYVQALMTSKALKVTPADKKAIAILKKKGGKAPMGGDLG